MRWEFYDRASPDYGYSQAAIFAAVGVVCFVIGTFTTGGLSLFGLFCLAFAVIWIFKARRSARKLFDRADG